MLISPREKTQSCDDDNGESSTIDSFRYRNLLPMCLMDRTLHCVMPNLIQWKNHQFQIEHYPRYLLSTPSKTSTLVLDARSLARNYHTIVSHSLLEHICKRRRIITKRLSSPLWYPSCHGWLLLSSCFIKFEIFYSQRKLEKFFVLTKINFVVFPLDMIFIRCTHTRWKGEKFEVNPHEGLLFKESSSTSIILKKFAR